MHVVQWVGSFIERLPFRSSPLPYWFENWCDKILVRTLVFAGVADIRAAFSLSEISLRTALFIEAARARGVDCKVVYLFSKPSEHLVLSYRGKEYYFTGYPVGAHANSARADFAGDKIGTKKHLSTGGFPTPRGKLYPVWQTDRAVHETMQSLGFPLVVKPERGTFSRHVTTDVTDEHTLRAAIAHAGRYQPYFLVEEYIGTGFVHRVTVIDFKCIAAARQVPAHIVGNGRDSIETLLQATNTARRHEKARNPRTLLHEIPPPSTLTPPDLQRIPSINETVVLHRNPFMRLGATIVDETPRMHLDIVELCEAIAKHFDIRCAGIDIILEDCSRPRSTQVCKILEINNLPSIEIHENRDEHGSHSVAAALVDVFFRYYVTP